MGLQSAHSSACHTSSELNPHLTFLYIPLLALFTYHTCSVARYNEPCPTCTMFMFSLHAQFVLLVTLYLYNFCCSWIEDILSERDMDNVQEYTLTEDSLVFYRKGSNDHC